MKQVVGTADYVSGGIHTLDEVAIRRAASRIGIVCVAGRAVPVGADFWDGFRGHTVHPVVSITPGLRGAGHLRVLRDGYKVAQRVIRIFGPIASLGCRLSTVAPGPLRCPCRDFANGSQALESVVLELANLGLFPGRSGTAGHERVVRVAVVVRCGASASVLNG
jgi:hypothetical protein